MKKISIIGIGMGNGSTITMEARRLIEQADVLIGAQRMLEGYLPLGKPVFYSYKSQEIVEFVKETEYKQIAVLMSGDVGFYSGANKLVPKLDEYEVQLIPGISSLSYFCAKLGISWEHVYPVSVHGRNQNLMPTIQAHHKTFALTEGNVSEICTQLIEADLGYVEVYVGENLSYENERITHGIPAELIGMEFEKLSAILVVNKQYGESIRFGIADDEFVRGNVPMTKSEVRAVIMSKLKLKNDSIAYDIGAGTGSVSVEMSLIAHHGAVYAIELKDDALRLIEQNKKKFCTENLHIVEGYAPDILTELPAPDTVFIGGSKGQMKHIFEVILEKSESVRVVITAIALETLSEVIELAKQFRMDEFELVQVGVARAESVASYHMMQGQNPIFIASGMLHREVK